MSDRFSCWNKAGVTMVFILATLAVLPGIAEAAKCFGKKATIVSSKAKVVGTKDHDVIVIKGKKKHTVDGAGGHDRICGSPGPDNIFGGGGNDQIDGRGGDDILDGSNGNDKIKGGAGNDLVKGDKGNDTLEGGSGNDRLEGLNGDDVLSGSSGNDILIGSSGTDKMYGGDGDDVLRGEGNNDHTDGGPGRDIASYSSSPSSIQVDLSRPGAQWTKDGNDTFIGIEDLVGSAFPDVLNGDGSDNRIDGGPGYDELSGGGGNDAAFGGPDGASCEGFASEANCGRMEAPNGGTSVILSKGLDGDSLVVAGDARNNQISVEQTASGYSVSDQGPSGIYTGNPENSGCSSDANARLALCAGGPLNVILITGGDGDDTVTVGASISAATPVRINGGDGSDSLTGGKGNDVLEAGYPYRGNREGGPTSGNDQLIGGEGVDSLYADTGADILSGGDGTDLLVSSKEACQGHTLAGGSGKDNASWALTNPSTPGFDGRMRMEVGVTGGPESGCANLDKVGSDIESLEGSKFDDTLIGDRGDNGFLGQGGADTFLGMGGKNWIDARDGERDKAIDCGGGRNTVLVDKQDPKPKNCPK